jgi:small nuclear ribonucleoprotein (snRNP)-like protein
VFDSHQDFLQGFDEFMNVVIDEAEEVFVKEGKGRRSIGEG